MSSLASKYGRMSLSHIKGRNKVVLNSSFKQQIRCLQFKEMFQELMVSKPKADVSHLSPSSVSGDKLLYEGTSSFNIRAMFLTGSVNLVYWTLYLGSYAMNYGVTANGLDLGGDYRLGVLGAIGTSLIFYTAREYSNHSAMYVYETADGKRLGFQMYTLLSTPGRKVEASIANVRLSNVVDPWGISSGSYVPIRIEGIERNVLIDKTGLYYDKERLKTFLKAAGNGTKEAEFTRKSKIADEAKIQRTSWLTKQYDISRQKREKASKS